MSTASRRGFIALSATGVAAAAAAPVAMAAVRSTPSSTTTGSADAPVVAYIKNAATGEISLLTGQREVVVIDAELVQKLTSHL